MLSVRFFVLALGAAVLLPFTSSTAIPPHQLESRAAKCNDGKPAPCICGGEFGIRKSALKCPTNKAVVFANAKSPTDGTMKKVKTVPAGTQCDHMVELQFIATKINAKAATCTELKKPANKAKLQGFIDFINDTDRLIQVTGEVNNAKGKFFKSATTKVASAKTRAGVASYLRLIKSDASNSARLINAELDSVVGAGNGMTNFQKAFNSKVTSIINKNAVANKVAASKTAQKKTTAAKPKAAAKKPAAKKPAAKKPVKKAAKKKTRDLESSDLE